MPLVHTLSSATIYSACNSKSWRWESSTRGREASIRWFFSNINVYAFRARGRICSSVSATLPIVSEREGVAEDSFALRFQLANGTEGVMQHTAGAWGPSTALARVAGTRGTLWLEDGKVWLADRDGAGELAGAARIAATAAAPTQR